MQNLINLPAPTTRIKGLKSFTDTMKRYIRELEGIGQYQESSRSQLIPLILNKFPNLVKQNITRDHGDDDWDISSLQKSMAKMNKSTTYRTILLRRNQTRPQLEFYMTAFARFTQP